MKGFLIKAPEGMLNRWRQAAESRKVTAAQMIREAVNKDIDAWERTTKAFAPDCRGADNHIAGEKCRWCNGIR